jgi:cysteinyl-tRNA synthetase
LQTLQASSSSNEDIKAIQAKCYEAMNDDFNTSVLIAHLFEAVRIINSANDKKTNLDQSDIDLLKKIYQDFVFDVLGLKQEEGNEKLNAALAKVVDVVLDMRNKAKAGKDFKLSDEIRDKLLSAGIQVKDTKEGTTWKV